MRKGRGVRHLPRRVALKTNDSASGEGRPPRREKSGDCSSLGGNHVVAGRPRWCPLLGAAAGLIAAAAPSARGQSVEELGKLSIEQLANIEVTSVTKSPEPLSRAAAAVYVITANDIIRSGATSLPEVLRLAPNLEVARLNAYNWAITARGFNSPECRQQAARSDRRTQRLFAARRHRRLGQPSTCRSTISSGSRSSAAPAAPSMAPTRSTASSTSSPSRRATRRAACRTAAAAIRTARTRCAMAAGSATMRPIGSMATVLTAPNAALSQCRNPDRRVLWRPNRLSRRRQSRCQRLHGRGHLYDHNVVANGGQFWGGNLNGWWSRRLDNGSTVKLQAYYSADTQNVPNNPPPPNVLERLDTYDVQGQQNMTLGIHQLVWGAEARAWQVGVFSSGAFFFAQPEKPLWLGQCLCPGRDLAALQSGADPRHQSRVLHLYRSCPVAEHPPRLAGDS